jgi:hypothetical protein
MDLLYKFLTLSPMDRIKAAQNHFNKGMTLEKTVLVIVVAAIVIALIVYGIIKSRK